MMELDEILEELVKNICNNTKFILDMNYNPQKDFDQAHSDILKWIKERLPKEMPPFRPSNFEKGFIDPFHIYKQGKTSAWNAYRQQALKNLGIKEG